MKKYELVVIINPNISKEEQNTAIEIIESYLPNGYDKKDDMWVLKVFNFEPAWKNKLAYYISYLVELDGQDIPDIKKKFAFVKWLFRHVFFSITNKSVFVNFQEINQKFSEIVKKEPKKSMRDKKSEEKKIIIDENASIEESKTEIVDDWVDVIPEYKEPKKVIKKKED